MFGALTIPVIYRGAYMDILIWPHCVGAIPLITVVLSTLDGITLNVLIIDVESTIGARLLFHLV